MPSEKDAITKYSNPDFVEVERQIYGLNEQQISTVKTKANIEIARTEPEGIRLNSPNWIIMTKIADPDGKLSEDYKKTTAFTLPLCVTFKCRLDSENARKPIVAHVEFIETGEKASKPIVDRPSGDEFIDPYSEMEDEPDDGSYYILEGYCNFNLVKYLNIQPTRSNIRVSVSRGKMTSDVREIELRLPN